MQTWEAGTTRNDAGAWVIVPIDGGAVLKFDKRSYPGLANITGGEAVRFTRNPSLPGWAAKIVLDTGLNALIATAQFGATFTHAARTHLVAALADRLFWMSFLPESERAIVENQLNTHLNGLKGAMNKQSLIDGGL